MHRPLKFCSSLFCSTWIRKNRRGRDGSVGIATRYGLDGPLVESRCGRVFPHPSRPNLRPNQPPTQWVPGLSRGKAAGAWRGEVKERVELYLYSPSRPSWPCLGWTLPLPLLSRSNRFIRNCWTNLCYAVWKVPQVQRRFNNNRLQNLTAWPLKMGSTGRSETSENDYNQRCVTSQNSEGITKWLPFGEFLYCALAVYSDCIRFSWMLHTSLRSSF